MTFSSLISGTFPHHNKFGSRDGHSVSRVIQHHWAGIGGGIERLTDPYQQASSSYIITSDGRIFGQVPEEFRPWTSGSYAADVNAITYEVQNSGGRVNGNDDDPSSWAITDAAYNAIIILTADIARRHGFGSINANNYQGHRQHSSTACPGGYLWSRMANTRAAAQVVLSSGNLNPSSNNSTEDIDMAGAADILARQAEHIAWEDKQFSQLRAEANANRNALAGFVRDLFLSGENVSEAELNAKLAEVIKSQKENSGVRLYKGLKSPDVYAWDVGTGARKITWEEFVPLRLAGADIVEVDQEVMDKLVGAAK